MFESHHAAKPHELRLPLEWALSVPFLKNS